jgi:hypothetical protein
MSGKDPRENRTTDIRRKFPPGFPAARSVGAVAKIPKAPVEKSPPPSVVNRNLLRVKEIPRLAPRGKDLQER